MVYMSTISLSTFRSLRSPGNDRFGASRLLRTDVWLRKQSCFRNYLEFRRTFGEGACDRLTKIDRTFETFSTSTLSAHGFQIWICYLFDVNMYAHLFRFPFFAFYKMLYGLTFVFPSFLIENFVRPPSSVQ
jgi:hypothetical protein